MDASGQEVEEEESTAAPTEESESSPEPTAAEDIDETTAGSVDNEESGEDYDYMWPTRPPMRPRPLRPWRRQ